MTRTYGKLHHAAGQFVITELEPQVAIRLKALFPGVPKATKVVTLPATPHTACDLGWFCDRYPLRGEGDALDALAGLRTTFAAYEDAAQAILGEGYRPPPFVGLRPGQSVRPHQAQAVSLLELFGGLLVGDETGKGKTYTGAAAMLLEGALPATVVCPPNLKRQWQKKIGEFTTLSCHLVQGTRPYPLPPADVRIFSYTILAGWADVLELMGTGLVIFDEVHDLRQGRATQKGLAAERLAEAARMRLGMTATPIFNYGGEIWKVMRFIRPDVFGDWEDFCREWCVFLGGANKNKWSVVDPKALGAYMREHHAFVRELKDTPRPNVVVHDLGDYDIDALASVEERAYELAVQATKGKFEERGRASLELDMMIRRQTGLAKARAVAAFVRVMAEGGTPVIVFGWHREVYDIWLEELSDLAPAMHTGSETPAKKLAETARFLNGETDVLIVSLRSGQGLDGLQHRCSTVIFGELDWSPAMHEQCIGRVDREGQACWPEPVDAIYLTVAEGSDPPIMEVLGLKASEAAHIVDPSLGVRAKVSDESRLRALVQRYLDRGPARAAAEALDAVLAEGRAA